MDPSTDCDSEFSIVFVEEEPEQKRAAPIRPQQRQEPQQRQQPQPPAEEGEEQEYSEMSDSESDVTSDFSPEAIFHELWSARGVAARS